MSRKDSFESPKRRFARGKQHIRRLEKRIQTFLKKGKYKQVSERQDDGTTVHALRFTSQFPESWSDSVAEALEALRSALDQTGYAAAVLGGVAQPKHAYFPIADTPDGLENVIKGRCRDVPEPIRTLFRSFDAHENGNYQLWALNKLCNANKHQLLVPVGLVGTGLEITEAELINGNLFVPRWNPNKSQIEIAQTQADGDSSSTVESPFT